jgi:SAM-dependent methyltransferase
VTALSSRYWAAAEPASAERHRLQLLEARYDPLTFRRLDTLGTSAGWSCLEVGAGAGSVARWLANRVGPSGHVVATDLDPRFLSDIGPANVHVRRHDIRTDPLEAGTFDLVHCRALLCHLEDPMAALRRMADALRPGGWLLVEDADYVTFAAACPDHPAAPAWDRAVLRMAQSLAAGDRLDPHLGRRLPGTLQALGLAQRGHEGLVRVHQGASPAAEYFRQSLEPLLERRIDAISVSDTDLEALTAALADPSFAFVDAISYAAWGRR